MSQSNTRVLESEAQLRIHQFRWIYLTGQFASLLIVTSLMRGWDMGNELAPSWQRLIIIWNPIIFGAFTLAHGILPDRSRSWCSIQRDIWSYSLLPVWMIIASLQNSFLVSNPFLTILFLGTIYLKGYNLLRHIIHTLRVPGYQSPRNWPVFLLVLTVCISTNGWFNEKIPLQGDEPYFMLISQSLLADGDLNLENNYLAGDSKAFMNRALEPQMLDQYVDGRLLSRHTSLLPLVTLPGYMMFGRVGILLSLSIIAAFLGMTLFRVAWNIGKSLRNGLFLVIAVMFSAPVVLYSNLIYTEILGAFLALLTFEQCMKLYSGRRLSTGLVMIFVILSGWLKIRFLIMTFPLIATTIALRQRFSSLLKWGSGLFLLLAAGGAVNWVIYGSPFVRYSLSDMFRASAFRFARGILAQLWDVQYGVFHLNPVLLCVLPGAIILAQQRHRSRLFLWLSGWVPYFLLIAGYAELIGGICPKGRFASGWVPLFAIPIAVLPLKRRENHWRFISGILLVLALAHGFLLMGFPGWLVDMPGACNSLCESLSLSLSRDLLNPLPGFDRIDRTGWIMGMVLLGLWVLVGSSLTRFRAGIRCRGITLLMTGCIGSALLLLPVYHYVTATSWMDAEDRVFQHSGTTRFWEEPYQWDRQYSLARPYNAGVELATPSVLRRSIPLRPGGEQLEIIARGHSDGNHAPLLEILAAGSSAGTLRILSDEFSLYRCPIPRNVSSLTLRLPPHVESGESTVIIDRIRRAPLRTPIDRPDSSDTHLLPIQLDTITIEQVRPPASTVPQGTPFELILHVSPDSLHPPELNLIARFRQNLLVFDAVLPRLNPGENIIPVTIPAGTGTGHFLVQLGGNLAGRPVLPSGENVFLNAEFAVTGQIQIDPQAQPSSPEIVSRFHERFPDAEILPHWLSVSGENSVTVTSGIHGAYRTLAVITNITDVLTIIPFQKTVGQLTIEYESGTRQNVPLVIGHHTAEDRCEFPTRQLKISHPIPDVFLRSPASVTWPPVLEGTEYESLVFQVAIPLNHVERIRSVTLQGQDPQGVLNIHVMGLLP